MAFGRANLASLDVDNVRVEVALTGVLGWPDEAPYDRVLVSAEAHGMPWDLAQQVERDGGVMVVPVDGTLVELGYEQGRATLVRHGHYAFVPLIRG